MLSDGSMIYTCSCGERVELFAPRHRSAGPLQCPGPDCEKVLLAGENCHFVDNVAVCIGGCRACEVIPRRAIPPRPWRVVEDSGFLDALVVAADNSQIVAFEPWLAALIVRLVNAEEQVVEALRSIQRKCRVRTPMGMESLDRASISATAEHALALLRDDRPGEGGVL